MVFKPIEVSEIGLNFNSTVSSNFRDLYNKILFDKYKKEEERKPSQTFAPSSFRCDRLSFFKIRGVEPDPVFEVDMGLEFSAIIGTACHEEIQKNLKDSIGDNWVSVSQYLKDNPIEYEYKINQISEFETRLEFTNPPVRFACDGIIKIDDIYYLLEIKTSEYQSFKYIQSFYIL